MRYGIMFTVKSPANLYRKVTVMDFKIARKISFTTDEIEGDESKLEALFVLTADK